MTQEEIIQGNKAIAEFMGIEKCTDPNHATNPCFYIDGEYHDIKYAKYPKSWDWLMPVVEKIHDECKLPKYCKGLEPFLYLTIFCGIETLYKNVIQFITWYNQQNQLP